MGWFPDLASDGRHTRLRQTVQACCHGQLIEQHQKADGGGDAGRDGDEGVVGS
jgi:hypothetical protein